MLLLLLPGCAADWQLQLLGAAVLDTTASLLLLLLQLLLLLLGGPAGWQL
jgi:hypothetical protein